MRLQMMPGSRRVSFGVGDRLVVQLFGKENATYTFSSRDGNINFPKLGAITVSGLTFEDSGLYRYP